MSKSDFDAFVEQQQTDSENAAGFDPKQQLKEWFYHLDILYKNINLFMEPYISSKRAFITFDEITLTEEFSGTYLIRRMMLRIGRSAITFTPVGTMLVGSKGRVDVQGPHGSARLILINKKISHARQLISVRISHPGESSPALPTAEAVSKIEWDWKIVTPPPDMGFIELTSQSFFDMILAVSRV